MSRIFTVDFTKSFIDELADHIQRAHVSDGCSLSRVAVVFGGQRPAQFLKRVLAARIGKAFVPPRIYTIDGLMTELADASGVFQPLSAVEERYELYTLAKEITPELLEGRASFAQFLPWAGEILDFIGELDLEDISADALKHIEASARIGYPVPDNINRLLERVLTLREAFHRRLLTIGHTRRSLQYLRAKENVAHVSLDYDEIIFANFFYFHRTEELVAKDLYARGQAVLMFQGDQRKWPVLERIAKRFGCELMEGEVPTPTHFKLDAYSAFDAHSSSAMARDILSGIKDQASTVVVLPDPGMLLPLLSAFPVDWAGVNVSMGYPVKRGSLFVLLQSIFQTQLSRRYGLYYARDYLAIVHHPLVKNLRLGDDPAVMRVLLHKAEELLKGRISGDVSGKLFVSLEKIESEEVLLSEARQVLSGMGIVISVEALAGALKQLHRSFFTCWEKVDRLNGFAAALGEFLGVMRSSSNMSVYPLNGIIADRINEVRDSFERASFASERFSIDEIIRIFEDSIEREMVSFSGTPLKGLQVLGLLETRSLNFDNAIIMDTNEGVLPKVEARSSLIPREVMSQLGIDRLELEEEIQRYQFMRLISSAKNVHVIYQQNKEKEPSRFLEELIWEQQVREGVLKPFPTKRAVFQTGVSGARRQVKKTVKMMEFLRTFTYSASSVNTYLKNPYEFYTRHVLGLREEEDMLDEPDAAVIGNFFHHFLEDVYRPFEGKKLEINDEFEMRFRMLFERHFKEAFTRRMRSDDFLVRRVMEHKLKAFLSFERERMDSIGLLVAVEKDYPGVLDLPSGRYLFKTRIDRVEEQANGILDVLDYKTGSSDKMPSHPLILSDSPDRQEIFDKVHSFQLPLYMYFVSQAFPGRLVNAGLYLLRSAEIKSFFTGKFPVVPLDTVIAPYWHALDVIMSEIMDPDLPFEDDDLSDFGRYE